ncbi:acyltransferase family protein [Dysgonomonas sp. 25]|uniref:acyltransferase family protein n=1 Tax=Dysgonomonas sp. 25 TaxID=2302933 RepID=UPI0013D76C2E|nr:DUF5009 domain-containing protein [Dysgonomonas sp. 25]NDV69903.1 DUF1624 domain-containing protein [Dysgonomonas sp. 25]
MSSPTNNRLLSLDILRGITIAGMILVNNPGSWKYVYAPLRHEQWHGITPTDLVFPFFMFIMGISTFISLRKYNFEFTFPTFRKIVKRTVVIFAIGVGLSWLSVSLGTLLRLDGTEIGLLERIGKAVTNFEHVRILGVMQRLALTYGLTGLIALFVKHKYIPYIIVAGLLGYFLLLLFGNGFEQGDNNILAIVDQHILGLKHMYVDSGLDPEGILSTIPATMHVLIGFCCGKILIETKDNRDRMLRLFIIGAMLTFSGFLLSYGCPMNKKIWSPTFVLATCGLASTLLSLLIWIIDVKGYKKWSVFFESFGVNPLFIYVLAGVLSILIGKIPIIYDGNSTSLKGFFYTHLLEPYFGGLFGSLIFAILFVLINWLIGNILYRKKIYIKI